LIGVVKELILAFENFFEQLKVTMAETIVTNALQELRGGRQEDERACLVSLRAVDFNGGEDEAWECFQFTYSRSNFIKLFIRILVVNTSGLFAHFVRGGCLSGRHKKLFYHLIQTDVQIGR
jgi:hypothetical protein